MAARGKHGASSGVTGAGRKAFLAARAQSTPAIQAARDSLTSRFETAGERGASGAPGAFSLLYESEDGRLRLFQTSDGHLCAVDSSRLA